MKASVSRIQQAKPLPSSRTADGEGGIRTRDTTIFSRVLYQLSYLAWCASGRAAGRLAAGRGSG
jgi:hypothetical protein